MLLFLRRVESTVLARARAPQRQVQTWSFSALQIWRPGEIYDPAEKLALNYLNGADGGDGNQSD